MKVATTEAGRELGRRLRKAREVAAENGTTVSRDRVARQLERDFNIIISDETIRRCERGDYDPEDVDIPLILALATMYSISLSSLSPIIAERAKSLSDLLGRISACITGHRAPAAAA